MLLFVFTRDLTVHDMMENAPFHSPNDFQLGLVIWSLHKSPLIDMSATGGSSQGQPLKPRPNLIVGINARDRQLELAPFTTLESTPQHPAWTDISAGDIRFRKSTHVWVGTPACTDMIFASEREMGYNPRAPENAPNFRNANLAAYMSRRNNHLFVNGNRDQAILDKIIDERKARQAQGSGPSRGRGAGGSRSHRGHSNFSTHVGPHMGPAPIMLPPRQGIFPTHSNMGQYQGVQPMQQPQFPNTQQLVNYQQAPQFMNPPPQFANHLNPQFANNPQPIWQPQHMQPIVPATQQPEWRIRIDRDGQER
ncbi:hypothetical protein C8R47DRAFT_1198586, partial [Mycena vitilis]